MTYLPKPALRHPKADKNAPYRRVRSVLHFDGVMNVKSQGLRLDRKEAVAAEAERLKQGAL